MFICLTGFFIINGYIDIDLIVYFWVNYNNFIKLYDRILIIQVSFTESNFTYCERL